MEEKRIFRILVNNVEIAKEILKAKKPNSFYDERYAIPAALLKMKIKLQFSLQLI